MKKLFVTMLLCVGLCFAACGQKEDGKESIKQEDGKPDHMVEINGKEYDLRKDHAVLLSDMEAAGYEVEIDNTMSITEKTKDGQYLHHPRIISYFSMGESQYDYGRISEAAYNDMGYLYYLLPAEAEGYVYSDALKSAIDSSYYADKDTYFMISSVGYGSVCARLYADGELLDILSYREQYQGLDDKKTFHQIFVENGIDAEDLDADWIRDLRLYAMQKYGWSSQKMDEWVHYITLEEAKELIPDINEELCYSFASYDVYKKFEEGSIKDYGSIAIVNDQVQSQYLEISVYTKDAAVIQNIMERIEKYSGETETE